VDSNRASIGAGTPATTTPECTLPDMGQTNLGRPYLMSVISQPLGSRRLFQPTFVGRNAELQQLEAAFESAAAGASALVAVLGEPGIGTEKQPVRSGGQLRKRVGVVGHCYEDGSLCPRRTSRD
jgi:hypothetical protein